jgi:P27 family predicted phage terminase small subunit
LKVLEGNLGHRPINDREPRTLDGEPAMPKHLTAIARREWKRLVPILLSMGVLGEGDGIGLAILCQAYGVMIEAQSLMVKSAKGSRSQLLMRTKSGYVMASPLLTIINQQAEIVSRQLQQFGMSPASRSRITATAPSFVIGSDDDPLIRKLMG